MLAWLLLFVFIVRKSVFMLMKSEEERRKEATFFDMVEQVKKSNVQMIWCGGLRTPF